MDYVDYIVKDIALKHQVFYVIQVEKPYRPGDRDETHRHLYTDRLVEQTSLGKRPLGYGKPCFEIGDRIRGYRLWKDITIMSKTEWEKQNYWK